MDPLGSAAWKQKAGATYDKETVAKLRPVIAQEIQKMIDNGEKSDCADVALAGLIRAASQQGLRVRLKYYVNGEKRYYDSNSDDYTSTEQFEKAVRRGMGAINLWDNTRQVKDINNLDVGDIVLYDLRDHNRTNEYTGHTMPVLGVTKDSQNKVTKVAVAEGHTSERAGEGTKVEASDYTPDQIDKKGGWGGCGRKAKQNGAWQMIEPGAREWDWRSVGG